MFATGSSDGTLVLIGGSLRNGNFNAATSTADSIYQSETASFAAIPASTTSRSPA